MVISIHPHGRSSKFNDLATLKIDYADGTLETPNRVVNKHDLNAKDGIGADIPLTRTSRSFILQENINPDKLNLILTKNGYLGEMLGKARQYIRRVNTSKSLIFIYPALTKDAIRLLDQKASTNFVRFWCALASEFGVESVMLPPIISISELLLYTNKRNLQLIPVLNLREKTEVFTKQYEACRTAKGQDLPIVAFKFAPYPNANKSYDLVMDDLDKLHEDKQATMIVDSPRFLIKKDDLSASAPHYSSIVMSDVVAERYSVGRGSTSKKVRIFCRKDLITPVIDSELISKRKFELNSELEVFANDKLLQDLMKRIVHERTDERDWYGNRPGYLSRVHENARSRQEFHVLQQNIDSDTITDYLADKKDMNMVIKNHLKDRLPP
jgi:hypothetical protein